MLIYVTCSQILLQLGACMLIRSYGCECKGFAELPPFSLSYLYLSSTTRVAQAFKIDGVASRYIAKGKF